MNIFHYISRTRISLLVVSHPLTSFTVGIVGIILTLVFGYFSLQMRDLNVSELKIGYAPYQMNDIYNLEDENLKLLKGANKYLRERGSEFRLYPYITNGTYTSVLNDLEKKDIHIAFLSQGIYALLKNKKICGHENGLKCNCPNANKFRLIGFKKHGSKAVYKSGILYNSKLNLGSAKETDIISTIKKQQTTILLNKDEYSTSSHIYPEVYLLRQGINIKCDPCYPDILKHKNISRSDMPHSIKKDSSKIAFISNEDFSRMKKEDKDSLAFFELSDPIPYDAVIVNARWWKSIGVKRRKIIQEALNMPPLGFTSNNCISDTIFYHRYHEFLFSGVIYRKDSIDPIEKKMLHIKDPSSQSTKIDSQCHRKKKYYIQLPDRKFDIYGLYDIDFTDEKDIKNKKDFFNACAYWFVFENPHSEANFSIVKDTICLVNVIRDSKKNRYYIYDDSLKLDRGMHILPYKITAK